MKRFLFFMTLFTLLLLVTFTACGGNDTTTVTDAPHMTTAPTTTKGGEDGTVTTKPTVTTAPVTTASTTTPVTTEEVKITGTLTISGNPIESYQIVYATSEYASLRTFLEGTEYDFYRITAEKIASDIEALTGVKLPVVDVKAEKKANEILVGPTGRPESSHLSGLGIYYYMNRVVGEKLVIGGGNDILETTGNIYRYYTYASTYHAFDTLYETLKTELTKGNYDLPDGFNKSGEKHITTVACVGDSITQGASSVYGDFLAYPAVLQRYLWQDYVVVNFGNSGRTMRNDVGSNYNGTPQYNALMKHAPNVDITLIMLGTNDSYFDRNWTEAGDNAYNLAAFALTSLLRRANPDMKLTVMNCPVYYGNNNHASPRVIGLQAKLPEYLATKNVKNVMFFNMNKFTAETLGISRFPDLLHPDATGYAMMAKELSRVVPMMLDGTWKYDPLDATPDAPKDPYETDKDVTKGSMNLLGKELDSQYDIAIYRNLGMANAPFTYLDYTLFEGRTITEIEMPIASAFKGSFLTVSVVKLQNGKVSETLSTHKLVAEKTCKDEWVLFKGLSIAVPEGYTLAFGAPTDTVYLKYIPMAVNGYHYLNKEGVTVGNSCLAFNIWASDSTIKPASPVEGSVNVFPKEAAKAYPFVGGFSEWQYQGAPYAHLDTALFSGKTVTAINAPIMRANAGGTLTVSVVKLQNGKVSETLSTHKLTTDRAITNEWVLFTDLNITIPEGYTIAFAATSDTVMLGHIQLPIDGYQFYGASNGAVYAGSAIIFDVYVSQE